MGSPGAVADSFATPSLNARWTPWTIGAGAIEQADGALRFVLRGATANAYSDAQITDYAGRRRSAFPWRAPLRLTVRAWASHSASVLKGTAGFGLWNEPFVPGGRGLPRLPRAAWFFFASPPSNMALAAGVPGWGWKAATLDASRPAFLLLAPLAPAGCLLMRVPALYRALWPLGQRALGVAEAPLPADLAEPHTYALEWRADGVRFSVDGARILSAPGAPRGPLGFIAWMDNQYAVVTPQGRFRFGLVASAPEQWLALDHIAIEPL